MKFTIELDDLVNSFIEDAPRDEYGIDDQFELKEEIKKSIINQVAYRNFSAEIKSMKDSAHELLKKRISEKMDEVIEKHVERIIRTNKVKFGYEKEPVTLAEYITKVYMDTSYSRKLKLEDIAKNVANEQAESLKERYDLLFASQLISRLDQLGMLKSDIAKILLEPK